MLSFFAVGSATVPPLNPAESADVVLELDRPMANPEYTVSILNPAPFLDGSITAEVTGKSETAVTVTVTAADGFAGTAVVSVICIQ